MMVNKAYPTDLFIFHILSHFLYVLLLVEAAKALQRFSFTDTDRFFFQTFLRVWHRVPFPVSRQSGGIPERLRLSDGFPGILGLHAHLGLDIRLFSIFFQQPLEHSMEVWRGSKISGIFLYVTNVTGEKKREN